MYVSKAHWHTHQDCTGQRPSVSWHGIRDEHQLDCPVTSQKLVVLLASIQIWCEPASSCSFTQCPVRVYPERAYEDVMSVLFHSKGESMKQILLCDHWRPTLTIPEEELCSLWFGHGDTVGITWTRLDDTFAFLEAFPSNFQNNVRMSYWWHYMVALSNVEETLESILLVHDRTLRKSEG